jgi:hypothetical protein
VHGCRSGRGPIHQKESTATGPSTANFEPPSKKGVTADRRAPGQRGRPTPAPATGGGGRPNRHPEPSTSMRKRERSVSRDRTHRLKYPAGRRTDSQLESASTCVARYPRGLRGRACSEDQRDVVCSCSRARGCRTAINHREAPRAWLTEVDYLPPGPALTDGLGLEGAVQAGPGKSHGGVG